MAAPLDTSGFNKKLKGLAQVAKALKALPVDAVAFAGSKLANELLNLPEDAVHPVAAVKGAGVIRRISGMLVRSISYRREGDNGIRLYMNEATAPYVQKVNTYSENRYGMGYLQLFLAFYSAEMLKKMQDEVKSGIHKVNSGADYVYFNPFPEAVKKPIG